MAAHDHAHDHAARHNQKQVFWAMLLTGGCMVAEVVGGLLAGSLALIADAGHMLTDTAALALAWAAFRVGHWPHDARRSYGYHRFQVLAAFVNSLGLIAVAGWIVIEAVRRLLTPVEVQGGLMLVIAAFGLVVNLAAFALLRRGDPENLNVQGALLHVVGDLLGSIGAIGAALVIIWTRLDADRPAALAGGRAADRAQRLAASAQVGAHPARGRARLAGGRRAARGGDRGDARDP